jgi:hypothetical protein
LQGDTLPLVATQITDTSREYRLWQKEQLAVLISRVSTCKDVIFVGERDDTRQAVERILGCSSKWDALVDHYLSALDVAKEWSRFVAREIRQDCHPFLPVYRELPAADCGYVYLLVSMAKTTVWHVGHADNLKKAVRAVNTGNGDEETRDTALHPWGVFAFVTGFQLPCHQDSHSLALRAEFSSVWNNVACRLPSLERVYERGCGLVASWQSISDLPLIIVKCGSVGQ